MKLEDLYEIMGVANSQPNFSEEMNRAWGYYDSKQIPREVLELWERRGQPAIINNYIAVSIDAILGMEAKTRTDVIVTPDEYNAETEEVCEGLNKIFYDVCKLSHLSQVISDAYKSQLICGMGFVEVIKLSHKQHGVGYKFKNIDWREIDWDFHSQELDWSDCRWVRRRFWLDLDKALLIFPDKAEEIKLCVNNFDEFFNTTNIAEFSPNIAGAYNDYKNFKSLNIDWVDQRKRVLCQVIYTREYYSKNLITINGEDRELNIEDREQQIALQEGKASVRKVMDEKIREYWFIGGVLVKEQDCNTPFNYFPIVPFFAYRENESNVPYGLVRRAMCAQDDINIRHSKATYMMQSKLLILDKDSTDLGIEQIRDEVNRPDGVIILNPDRRNGTTVKDALNIQTNIQDGVQMYNIMKDAKTVIPDVMGVFNQFLGKQGGAESGTAIANLVEQGANNLTELNDNYNFSRMLVGEILLGYLLKEYSDKQVSVTVGDYNKRKIMLNMNVDGIVRNSINDLRCHITLQDVEHTQAYKQQLANMLVQIMSSASPEFQPMLFPMLVEQLNVPNKEKVIGMINKQLGLPKPPEEMTEQEQQEAQAQQQQQQLQQELEQQRMKLEIAKLQAEVDKLRADAQSRLVSNDKVMREIQSQDLKDKKTRAETIKLLTEAENTQQWTLSNEDATTELSNMVLDKAMQDVDDLIGNYDLDSGKYDNTKQLAPQIPQEQSLPVQPSNTVGLNDVPMNNIPSNVGVPNEFNPVMSGDIPQEM